MNLVNTPYPTKTRLAVFAEVQRREVRWYHWIKPEARNVVTDRVRTAIVEELAAAKLVDLGEADPGNYSVVEETDLGRRWAGPGSISPEPGPPPVDLAEALEPGQRMLLDAVIEAAGCTCNGQWTCCYCTGCSGCSECEPAGEAAP